VILITGIFRIPSNAMERARPIMEAMIAASRKEDGCLAYTYAPDLIDTTLIHVVERWTDRAALDRHFASDHLAQWRAAFPTLGITDRALELFEVDAGEAV